MEHTGREALIALSVLYHGNWDRIYEAIQRREFLSGEKIQTLLQGIQSNVVTLLDQEYPSHLREHCHKAPFVLFYYGDLSLAWDQSKILTVVGSRSPTSYALSKTHELCAEMAKKGYVLCSGLARGIDAAVAEESSVYPGKSIAVLGCGVDAMYPMENLPLKNKISANGLLLSEYPGKTPPDSRYFPSRNRILACIAQGVLIAEAAPKSGTLITAAYAMKYSRDIAALPFRAEDGLANNSLIKYGAALVETSADLELFMNRPFSMKKDG